MITLKHFIFKVPMITLKHFIFKVTMNTSFQCGKKQAERIYNKKNIIFMSEIGILIQ